ncbi:hypothetical protein [Schaalia suimastitidis]|uniref:hypothetical protein n=1 Tax=Schaalia suimastitidis TaxID=121163 RepID=UPI0003FB8C86|nr:hypothetical protein [Schaalia suimastitidis]
MQQRLGPHIVGDDLTRADLRALRALIARLPLKAGAPSLTVLQQRQDGDDVALALCGTIDACQWWRSRFVTAIHVGSGGGIQLPRDEAVLLTLIEATLGGGSPDNAKHALRLAFAGYGRRDTPPQVVSACARALAASKSTYQPVVINAAGDATYCPDTNGIFWADLDANEDTYLPEMASALPACGTFRVLESNHHGAACADDVRIVKVLEALTTHVTLLDVGRWDDRAHKAIEWVDALILCGSGRADSIEAACIALSRWAPQVPLALLTTGKTWPLARALLDQATDGPSHVQRCPRGRASWLRLVHRLTHQDVRDIGP